jgi:hypothetical protein
MKTGRRLLIGKVLTLSFIGAALLLSPARADNLTMNLEDLGHGTYRLEGRFKLAGSPYDVWKVLTDFEHISTFVTSLRKSAVTQSTTDRILLEQEALGKEFVFTKKIRVLLQVTEMPYRRILFEDTSHTDFTFYEGSWEIQSVQGGLDVIYRLSCKRNFMVPNALAKDALRKSAEELLAQVQAEVLRRKQGGKSPC